MKEKGLKLARTVTLIHLLVLLLASPLLSAERPKHWPKAVSIGSGTGTTYYAIAGGIGKMMEKYLGVAGIPTKTSGGEETARLMHSGDLDMGFITPDVGYDAYRGIGNFKDIGPAPIRVFLQDFPLHYNLVTLEGSGINSWSDLKGKSGYYRSRGSSIMELLWEASINAYGVKRGDVKNAMRFDRASEWIDAMKTGKIDFALDCGFHPAGKWLELANTHPMKIIPVDDTHLKKIQEQLPWIFPLTIKGGIYKTMPDPVQTAAFAVVVDCRRGLPANFVYAVTKMIWTHFDEFKTYHPVCKFFSPEAVKRTNFAFHKGAIKYYKEIGVWGPEEDKRQQRLLDEIGVRD
ncbi:MAG: TAXI family TRAP transporter solute-binding subunit [Deltaproteobacteria bacterium]|nr:TAXI family TRAP transporter solute-binding subunit [Deltaproteobacteria bacterium]